MARRLELRHHYPNPPESIREELTDPQYLADKLRTVGGPGSELVSREQDECGVTIVIHHPVPKETLPSFLRSILPSDLTIHRTEIWTSSGGSMHVMVDGAPGTITGSMRLEPDPDGCVLGSQLTAEVALPLFSGKAERAITDNVATLMETEYRFTLEWLRACRA